MFCRNLLYFFILIIIFPGIPGQINGQSDSTYFYYESYYNQGVQALQDADQYFEESKFKEARSAYDTAIIKFNVAEKEPRPEEDDVEEKIQYAKKQQQLIDDTLDEVVITKEIIERSNKLIYFADAAIENEDYPEALLMTYLALKIMPNGQDSSTQLQKFRNAVYHYSKKTLTGPDNFVDRVRLSPAGNTFAAVRDSNQILWGSFDTDFINNTASRPDEILDLAYSKDGRFLATGEKDGTMALWSTTSQKLIKEIKEHNGPVLNVKFSQDGRWLLTASRDSTIKIWELVDGIPSLSNTIVGHMGAVQEAFFSEDNNWIFSRSSDGSVRLWEFGTRIQLIRSFQIAGNYIYDVAFSPLHNLLSVAGIGSGIHLWTLPPQEGSITIPFEVTGTQIIEPFQDGSKMLIVDLENKVRIINLNRPEEDAANFNLTGQVRTATISPNGKELVFGFSQGKVELTDLRGNVLMLIPAKNREIGVKDVQFSHDGHFLIVLYDDGSLQQCSLPHPEKQKIYRYPDPPLSVSQLRRLNEEELRAYANQLQISGY